MADGPAAALPLLDPVSDALTGYYLLPAVRGDLLAWLGRDAEASAAFGSGGDDAKVAEQQACWPEPVT